MPENCEGGCGEEVGYGDCVYIECDKGFTYSFCKKCHKKRKNENRNRI